MKRRGFLLTCAAALASPMVPAAVARTLKERGAPYLLVHGDCGRPAFLLLRKPNPGDLLRSSDILQIDGAPMVPGTPCVCGSCGVHFLQHTSDVLETSQTSFGQMPLFVPPSHPLAGEPGVVVNQPLPRLT